MIFNNLKYLYTRILKLSCLEQLIIFLIIISLIYFSNNKKEGYTSSINYISNDNDNYHDNYLTLYDNIITDHDKDIYLIDTIVENINYNNESKFLNIGCKTGNINNILSSKNIINYGLDTSSKMINIAEKKYPESNFILGDINNNIMFNNNPFTHILCLNLEIYNIHDKNRFFNNCNQFLQNNGYLILHLMDENNFNSIAAATKTNPLLNVNNYMIKKINNQIINYNDIIYKSKYSIYPNDFGANGEFKETIIEKNTNNIIENIKNMYILDRSNIINIAKSFDFKLLDIIEIKLRDYKNEYIYILKKK